MDKELAEAGCECIQQLLSIIEDHIHWDDFFIRRTGRHTDRY